LVHPDGSGQLLPLHDSPFTSDSPSRYYRCERHRRKPARGASSTRSIQPAEVIVQGPIAAASSPVSTRIIDGIGLEALLGALRARGYGVLGPKMMGTAITFAPIASADDLPCGWISHQEPGHYRLERSRGSAAFAYGPAVESLKRYLNPPVSTIWRATREDGTLRFEGSPEPPARLAVVGVRSCDLHAMARCDDVFLKGPYVDPGYQARRASLFLVAANCTRAASTCFCASMGTGPRASALFDMALTELPAAAGASTLAQQIGRASCRERV
jgi:hypothetical protein